MYIYELVKCSCDGESDIILDFFSLSSTTAVGKYSPDWAISFKKGPVKHIFFIAETKGTMDSLELRPIEQAKISCAKKLFNELSTSEVKYHDVDTYQNLLSVIDSL